MAEFESPSLNGVPILTEAADGSAELSAVPPLDSMIAPTPPTSVMMANSTPAMPPSSTSAPPLAESALPQQDVAMEGEP